MKFDIEYSYNKKYYCPAIRFSSNLYSNCDGKCSRLLVLHIPQGFQSVTINFAVRMGGF